MKKILLMLLLPVMFISCNKENEDVVEKTTLTVESQIKEYTPWGSDHSMME